MFSGDFNADCSYLSKKKLLELSFSLDAKYHWAIGSNADTTIATGTDCAYDRIIVTGDFVQSAIDSSAVYDLSKEYNRETDAMLRVTDHFPVAINLRISTDGDDYIDLVTKTKLLNNKL